MHLHGYLPNQQRTTSFSLLFKFVRFAGRHLKNAWNVWEAEKKRQGCYFTLQESRRALR